MHAILLANPEFYETVGNRELAKARKGLGREARGFEGMERHPSPPCPGSSSWLVMWVTGSRGDPTGPPRGVTAPPPWWTGGGSAAAGRFPHPLRLRRVSLASAGMPAAPPRSGRSARHRADRRTPLRPSSALAPA